MGYSLETFYRNVLVDSLHSRRFRQTKPVFVMPQICLVLHAKANARALNCGSSRHSSCILVPRSIEHPDRRPMLAERFASSVHPLGFHSSCVQEARGKGDLILPGSVDSPTLPAARPSNSASVGDGVAGDVFHVDVHPCWRVFSFLSSSAIAPGPWRMGRGRGKA